MKTRMLRTLCVGLTLTTGLGTVHAQNASLSEILKQSVAERVQLPAVFSTRDSLFALSLPDSTEGPAEVYIQLTVGRNGQVKEKKTRVSANHVGAYVAPAFIAAAKGMRIDRDSVPALTGRDTAVLLTIPLEYRCVLDTMTKAWPNAADELQTTLKIINTDAYPSMSHFDNYRPMTNIDIENAGRKETSRSISFAEWKYKQTIPTAIWYYLVFLKNHE